MACKYTKNKNLSESKEKKESNLKLERCLAAQRLEKDEKEKAWQNKLYYRLPCRLENWNEDLYMREEKSNFATYKRERSLLTIQKTKKMFKNLLTPTKLCQDLEFLKYGENYQIIAPDVPCNITKCGVCSIYLSGIITEKEIDTVQELCHGCLITGSRYDLPCIRNTFKIIGCERDKCGEPVCYGEDVYFQIVDNNSDTPLYIQCENSLQNMGYHLNIRLSKCLDTYCRFKILHLKPELRYETEGSQVEPNQKIIIKHNASGRNLAIERDVMTTFFGQEFFVSCHIFRDCHRMETAENVWKFAGEDLPNINMFVQAAKGFDVPEDLIK